MAVLGAVQPEYISRGAGATASPAFTTRSTRFILACWLCPALLSGTANTAESIRIFQPDNREPLASEACPNSCSDVFSKLEGAPLGGARSQRIQVQERGGK